MIEQADRVVPSFAAPVSAPGSFSRSAEAMCGREPTFYCSVGILEKRTMALQLDQIRAIADRVAASHHLEVVDLEFSGGAKHRTLRVFIEKDAEGRAKLAQTPASEEQTELPKGVPVEMLSGVTHDDCTVFTQDFGTLLDVED